MASTPLCRTCVRAALRCSQFLPKNSLRTFTRIPSLQQTETPSQLKPRDIFEQPAHSQSKTENLAQKLRTALPQATESYVAYSGAEALFNAAKVVADYDIPQVKTKEVVPKAAGGEDIGTPVGNAAVWYNELNLTPTFNTWAQLTMLHLYILTTRLRLLPHQKSQSWQQQLTDHFFIAAELKMESLHSMTSRGTRAKYLKDLFLQWRGVLLSYDEGLVKGDAVLAAAVWRNVFGGREDVDAVKLGMVVGYLRREVARCAGVSEGEMMRWGRWGELKDEESVVLMKSHLMDVPFSTKVAP